MNIQYKYNLNIVNNEYIYVVQALFTKNSRLDGFNQCQCLPTLLLLSPFLTLNFNVKESRTWNSTDIKFEYTVYTVLLTIVHCSSVTHTLTQVVSTKHSKESNSSISMIPKGLTFLSVRLADHRLNTQIIGNYLLL